MNNIVLTLVHGGFCFLGQEYFLKKYEVFIFVVYVMCTNWLV